MILDAHVHVWDPERFRYDWLAEAALDRPHLPPQIDAAGVAEWVFVEANADAASAVDEAAWVAALDWPGLRAIVAGVDLEAPDLADRIARLRAIPLVRGVRHGLQDAPLDAFASPAMRAGLRDVAESGMTFDACVQWTQLDALTGLVRAVPGASVVLDHLGKPPVEAGLGSDDGRAWLRHVTALAAEGVSVKLSGLGAEAPTPGILHANGPDFVRAALDVFGPDRCLFGSDWPVSAGPRTGVATADWVALVRGAVGDAWRMVSGPSARRFYGLALDRGPRGPGATPPSA